MAVHEPIINLNVARMPVAETVKAGARIDAVDPKRRLKTLVLTNTRQSIRFDSYVPDHAPDPFLEYQCYAELGIQQDLRDRNNFPINPWANSGVFLAGIDLVRALRILMFDRKVDAVLCVFENTALVLVALRWIFRFRPPILLYEVSSRGWRPRDMALDFVLPRVEQVLTLTEHSKRYVERCYSLKRPAIVTGYSIDDRFFRPDAPLTTERPAPDDFILAVGDDYSRDYQTLVRAASGLDLRLVLRTGQKLHIPDQQRDRVTTISDRLSYRELRDLYSRARLVVLPLHPVDNPGGITSLFEGMAMGKLVICSRTGTTADYVRDGETGLLVAPEDPDALRAAITRVLADPEEARRIGAAARQYVERNLSKAEFVARMAAAIRAVAA